MGICKKVMYASEQLANQDIARIKQKSTRAKQPTRAYLCNICNTWHLTSIPDYKKLYNDSLQEITQLKSGGYAKSLEIKLYKLQQKMQSVEKTSQSDIDKSLAADARIKTLNDTISKQVKTITRLQKDNSDLINKITVLNKKTEQK
jgi:hypothetical protein